MAATWSASATIPANMGAASLVPHSAYQPAGWPPKLWYTLTAPAQDLAWPQFRGPESLGVVDDASLVPVESVLAGVDPKRVEQAVAEFRAAGHQAEGAAFNVTAVERILEHQHRTAHGDDD